MRRLTCIVCPKGCDIDVEVLGDGFETRGNQCVRGREYAISEMTNPKRSITSTVKTIFKEVPRLPVRTDVEIELKDIFPIMKELNTVKLDHAIHSGEIVVSNILGTGANIIATSDIYELLGVN